MTGPLVEHYGTPGPDPEPLGLSHIFPPGETLATANLEGVGPARLQADAIRSLSVAVATGSTGLDQSAGLEQLTDSIAALRGVGDETARQIAFRLGEPEGRPVSDRSPAGLCERARPWRALAATHIWLAGSDPQRAGGGTAA